METCVSTAHDIENSAMDVHEHRPSTRPQEEQKQRESFLTKARRTQKRAIISGLLHKCSCIVGFCTLTWASVVLLGGFASTLRRWDFILVSVLLILEVFRFVSIQFSFDLLLGNLYHEHSLPEKFAYVDKQISRGNRLVFMGQIMSLCFALASLGATIVRLSMRSAHELSEHKEETSDDDFSNLPISLWTFYGLVIVKSSFSVISTLSFAVHRGLFRALLQELGSGASMEATKQCSLDAFYDAIYRAVTQQGIAEALRLKVEEFAFDKIGNDLERRIRPVVVKNMHEDMIHYLFGQAEGVAMAYQYLRDGGDIWRQMAAANLPGFWAAEYKIERHVALFWRLRERTYGPGWDAHSALNSIQRLARQWAKNRTFGDSERFSHTASRRDEEGTTTHRDNEAIDTNRDDEGNDTRRDVEGGGSGDDADRARGEAHTDVADATHPFLVNDPFTDGNVVDTLTDLLLRHISPSLLFQVRAFEACCRDSQIRSYLYNKQAKEKNRASATRTNDLMTRDELQMVICGGGRPRSSLERLCRKLYDIVRRQDRISIITKIYASKALMCLLLHHRGTLSQDTLRCLSGPIRQNIRPFPSRDSGQLPKFLVEDVEATEMVCHWVGIPVGTVDWSAVDVIDVNRPDEILKLGTVEEKARDAYYNTDDL